MTEQVEEKTQAKVREQFALEIKDSKEELAEAKKRNQELLEQLTDLNKLIRELKRKDEERTLEMEKRLAESEDKIRQEAKKKAEEEEHLKLLEKDKQLADAEKIIMELKQKVQQGSQQTQGEVLELELEKALKEEFPNDKITPVGKGVRGADVIQEVWDRNGVRCGVILWESKNAKWNSEWIDKLKEDQRQLKAEIAAIISENLPPEVKGAAFKDGVWIGARTFAVGLAMALRASLIQAHHIKKSVQGKNEKMEVLYGYLTGVEFRQRVESIVDAFTQMQEELEKERRWFGAKWARQEKALRNVLDHTLGMHGDLQGILGGNLPEIKSLEAPVETEEKPVEEKLL
jgi:hypothetical protein